LQVATATAKVPVAASWARIDQVMRGTVRRGAASRKSASIRLQPVPPPLR
jgi:hypothetical protein